MSASDLRGAEIHGNFNDIDNNPTDATFGAVMGKSGQRILQIGARFFF